MRIPIRTFFWVARIPIRAFPGGANSDSRFLIRRIARLNFGQGIRRTRRRTLKLNNQLHRSCNFVVHKVGNG